MAQTKRTGFATASFLKSRKGETPAARRARKVKSLATRITDILHQPGVNSALAWKRWREHCTEINGNTVSDPFLHDDRSLKRYLQDA